MALDIAAFKSSLRSIKSVDKDKDPDEAWEEMINIFAAALEAYVKSGDVVVTSGSSAGTYKVT